MTLLIYLLITIGVYVVLWSITKYSYVISNDKLDLSLLSLAWPATLMIVAGIFVAISLDKIFK